VGLRKRRGQSRSHHLSYSLDVSFLSPFPAYHAAEGTCFGTLVETAAFATSIEDLSELVLMTFTSSSPFKPSWETETTIAIRNFSAELSNPAF